MAVERLGSCGWWQPPFGIRHAAWAVKEDAESCSNTYQDAQDKTYLSKAYEYNTIQTGTNWSADINPLTAWIRGGLIRDPNSTAFSTRTRGPGGWMGLITLGGMFVILGVVAQSSLSQGLALEQ